MYTISCEEEIEIDDYVGENCLMWCQNCEEILFCPTGSNSSGTLFDILEYTTQKSNYDCYEKISRGEAMKYINEEDLIKIENISGYYLIGVLMITHIVSSSEFDSDNDSDSDDESHKLMIESKYHEVRATRFLDIPDNVNTHCKREYENKIW